METGLQTGRQEDRQEGRRQAAAAPVSGDRGSTLMAPEGSLLHGRRKITLGLFPRHCFPQAPSGVMITPARTLRPEHPGREARAAAQC